MGSRVAVVTGANKGLGLGIVERLAAELPDWTILLTARDEVRGVEGASGGRHHRRVARWRVLGMCVAGDGDRVGTRWVVCLSASESNALWLFPLLCPFLLSCAVVSPRCRLVLPLTSLVAKRLPCRWAPPACTMCRWT